MAEYGGGICLSHSQQPPTSDDSSSDHSPPKKLLSSSSAADMAKKPRGRPPGSKNKPKPPIVITKEVEDNPSAMKPVVIEISAGNDVVETLLHFARKRHLALSLLSASGSVSNLSLRHPLSLSSSLSLRGPFTLLSLSGSFLPIPTPSSPSFAISLAADQGQVFGGIVSGKVTAASLVVIVAATFKNPVFHRLPSEMAEDDDRHVETAKPAINAADESAATATTTSSATPMSVCVYNAPSPPADLAMPWGPSSRTSY